MEFTEVARYTLDRIVSTVGELPPVPSVISIAVGLTSNLHSDISDVSKVLSSDQSLVAKILRLSNSPYYGRSREVKTVHEAIVVLGFDVLRSIVVAASAYVMYSGKDGSGSCAKLWRHSVSTAIAARQIGEHLKLPDKEEVFIAGLLHDIGKLVLMQKLPELYQKVISEVERTTCSFTAVESRSLGFDHCDVASLLLSEWAFPRSLVQAISRHHRPPSFQAGEAIPNAQVVNLANCVAKNIEIGFNDQRVQTLTNLDSARAMGLDEKSLDSILEESREHYRAEVRLLEDG